MKDNRVLLIQKDRGPHTGKWDLPGGTIEFGEDPYDTLIREFEEETGITQLKGAIRSALSYTDGDEQDSLRARWIALEELPNLPVTPVVEQLLVR
ncbi:8-oxo-dGTP diphosphatase [compost metagenome]